MIYRDIITKESGRGGGKPAIRGLRITVEDILKMLASGMSFSEIIADYPDLREDDIKASLLFASEREHGSLIIAHEVVA